jgi:hypothetical protein
MTHQFVDDNGVTEFDDGNGVSLFGDDGAFLGTQRADNEAYEAFIAIWLVGAFPDSRSCLNLAAARLRYIAGSAWSTKRYMNMRPLYQPQVMQPGTVA